MKDLPVYHKVGGSNRWPNSCQFIIVAWASVDDAFYTYNEQNQIKWFLNQQGYPSRYENKTLFLHHSVWEWAGRTVIDRLDHEDRNPLNAQLHNLRDASRSQNAANRSLDRDSTSGFKGVHWDKYHQKWRAHIRYLKKQIRLGNFDSATQAALIYDEAAIYYFGVFALTNQKLGYLLRVED